VSCIHISPAFRIKEKRSYGLILCEAIHDTITHKYCQSKQYSYAFRITSTELKKYLQP